jgi:signal transduction histidine kinase
MIKGAFVILFYTLAYSAYAQQNFNDSLKQIVHQNKQDTNEVNALLTLSINTNATADALNYARQALSLCQKIHYVKGEANSNLILGSKFGLTSNTAQSIQYTLNALNIYEQLQDNNGIAQAHLLLQGSYREAEDLNNALLHEFAGYKIAEKNNVKGIYIFPDHRLAPLFLAEIAQTYILKNSTDSALFYAQKSIAENELFNGTSWEFPVYLVATIQQMKGDYNHSLEHYRLAVSLAKVQVDNVHDTLQIYSGMSTLFRNTTQLDSSIYFAEMVNKAWNPEISEVKNLLEAINNLYEVYKLKGQKDSTLKYLELNYRLRENFFNTEREKQIQEMTFSARLKQQQMIAEQAQYESKLQAFVFIAGFVALLVITALIIRNSRQTKKAKVQIEKAYNELRTTQAQLIQSEKMASLGELTAGIAHEIQNPLNFVNNFSDVNRELLEELKEEADKGNIDEVKTIANDVIDNSEKINHHGKRADAIVKGMLQHSRASTGKKEQADINALTDEYLRLSYHGMRAKDKSFNATLQTDFDESIGKINVVPQDIGRVMLNFFNNAFYAVMEKKKNLTGLQDLSGLNNYEPTVFVSTKKLDSKIEIRVRDNGIGIPQKVVDKIFQPFFTTKPTGQGTGLGLSLSYDIIKAHGGEIKVETKVDEFAEFIFSLPLTSAPQ